MTKFFEHRKQKRVPKKSIVVFYHANCTDGFTAAWVVWKKFGSKAEYIASFHEDTPPEIKNKRIYTVDMTFPEAITKKLIRDNIMVTSIDHHESSRSVTILTGDHAYAVNNSGSTLAWKYFFPEKPIPKFLLNVEDVDLWRKKIPGSFALYSFLDMFDFNFEVWSRLIRDFEIPFKKKKMLDVGKLFLKYDSKMIDRRINKNAKLVKFEGHKIYAINETESVSEVGARLCRIIAPFSVIWHENKNGQISVSLRGNGHIDVSLIAQKYGGGGHKNSAAFRLKAIGEIPWRPA